MATTPGSPRKPGFSPTRLNTFLECEARYKYIYIDKIGKFYSRSTPGLSFGSSLHGVLQRFHLNGGIATPQELVDDLRSSWISAGYESAEQEREYFEAGIRILTSYHQDYHAGHYAQAETIATEKTLSHDYGTYKLTGRVDRIDKHPDGALEVVDYKSGRSDVTEDEVAASLAMRCYQLILRRLYPESAVRGTIYCLSTGKLATHQLEESAMIALESEIAVIVNRIQSIEWDEVRPVPVDVCPDCEFLSRCRTYWRQQERMALLDEP